MASGLPPSCSARNACLCTCICPLEATRRCLVCVAGCTPCCGSCCAGCAGLLCPNPVALYARGSDGGRAATAASNPPAAATMNREPTGTKFFKL